MNEQIAKLYKQLGPFNFFSEKIDDEISETRSTINQFDKRKSGAQYRGEIDSQTNKPDGMGFKVYPNSSVYEGHFIDG